MVNLDSHFLEDLSSPVTADALSSCESASDCWLPPAMGLSPSSDVSRTPHSTCILTGLALLLLSIDIIFLYMNIIFKSAVGK